MNTIIYTIIVALALGFLLGLLLGLFKKIFAVKTDPRVDEVRKALPGANCGGCGYAGCDSFALAVVKGDAPAGGCVAGGSSCAKEISKIMGVESSDGEKKIIFLSCAGTKNCAKTKAEYIGVKTCAAAQLSMNGTKACSFGCIGFGDCVNACPFGAIKLTADGIPLVDENACVGCGKCEKACPKHLLKKINADTKGAVAVCSNRSENKPQIRKDCTAGCFKCGMCEKKCPEGALHLENGLPNVDYSKCTSCGECAKACVDHVIKIRA